MLIGASTGLRRGAAHRRARMLGLAGGGPRRAAANLLFGLLVVSRGANQLAAGLTLMFFGFGASALIGRALRRRASCPTACRNFDGFGRPAVWLAWRRTGDRAVVCHLPHPLGAGPARGRRETPPPPSPPAAGPSACRYQALLRAASLGGLAGAHLSLALTMTWDEGMTAGRGFIAIALVIFASWNPLWAVPGALVFGGAEALQLQLQARGADVSPFLMNMTPYLLTLLILVLWGWNRQLRRTRGAGP